MDENSRNIVDSLQELNRNLKLASFSQIADAIVESLNIQETHTILASMLVNARVRHLNADLVSNLANSERDEFSAISSIDAPIGMMSSDASALLGREGYMFLVGGSNDVLRQYSTMCNDDADVVAQWSRLITNRIERAASERVRYHHLIIPEKISIIPELFPRPIASPTRVLDQLEQVLLREHGGSIYTSVREIFWKLRDRKSVCRKTDSHLAPFGSFLIFKYIMQELFCHNVADYKFSENGFSYGDLSFRMLGLFLPELEHKVDLSGLPHFTARATKSAEFVPEDCSHMGRRQVWRNPEAPIREKIVVFGNSYFSFAENGQSTLSWWFSRWFQEFHFVWTNEMDWDYVADQKPQVVIWQGTERFLRVVPGC
ncbi:hypothetical protein MKK58_02885 [Methylobacterium sp. J-078]|uniref:hypothetical protein n=1 Tax=Methylobacterium sp. J-078 TaxID=2836657 RepID=UPI001FBAF804|nr:hypothetical protein [Methylobacterium sp. J-078]MCJ2043490.1 hypothetical protein [Methylobacterium sp. J-078]